MANKNLDRCECTCGRQGCVSRRRSGVLKHGKSGYSEGCRCEVCTKEQTAWTVKQRAALNETTRAAAVKHYQQWTSAELEFITQPGRTAREAGAAIGRTMQAVKTMRLKCKTDPKYVSLLGASRKETT